MGAVDWIRTVFRRQRERVKKAEDQAGLGEPLGIDLYSYYGLDAIGDYLRVDQDLVARYLDYIEMLSYPEIAAAVDLYSEDATQPNTLTGETVWVESDDEEIREDLGRMLKKRLSIEDEIWGIAKTLVTYGNEYEEILVTEDEGVVGLHFLPPETMRRVEGVKGQLLGFIQDPAGTYRIRPEEFEEILKHKRQSPSGVVAFEDWQVVHFRLQSKFRQSSYGLSVLEPARWIWKRLLLLEDAMMIYRLCLRGDTNVWTTDGYKRIRDVRPGDEVYSFTAEGRLKKSKVVYSRHNGRDKIYRVRSRTHDLFANATHPVLVETWEELGTPCGDRKVRVLKYVEVQNLIPGKHSFVTPWRRFDDGETISLKFPGVEVKSELVEVGGCGGVSCGAPMRGRSRDVGFVGGGLDAGSGWEKSEFPEVATEDFSRWFGFMMGNGFVSIGKIEGWDGKSCRVYEVGFWTGAAREVGWKYKELFERFVGGVDFESDSGLGGDSGRYYVVSKGLALFLKLNGYRFGVRRRRIPEWVYRAKPSVGLAFLEGFLDAKGCDRKEGKYRCVTLRLSNRNLVEDVRQLAMQLGLRVTRVRSRVWALEGEVYEMDIRFCPPRGSEPILEVRETGIDDIYDIGVEAEEHNFVADGVVVHNTRAPSRFAFYVDVGEMPPRQAERFLERIRQRFRKKRFVNPTTGKLDLRFSPLSQDEDFYVPVRGGRESTRIEVLQGPDFPGSIDDVLYLYKKLLSALKIPPAYLGVEGDVAAKNVLAHEDVRFARSVLRIQRELRNGLKKVCNVHLASRNIDPESVDYNIFMTVPSGIYELAQMEIRKARVEFAELLGGYVSKRWVMREILGFSDDQIDQLMKEKKQEEMEEGSIERPERTIPPMRTLPAEGFGDLGKLHRPLPGDRSRKVMGHKVLVESDENAGDPKFEKWLKQNLGQVLDQNKAMKKRLEDLQALCRDMRMVMSNGRGP